MVTAGSGDVEFGTTAGPTVVKTGSGDLRVAIADGDLAMSTGSGDATVNRLNRGRFSLKGASGDLRIGIPRGVPVWTDISPSAARVRSDLASAGEPADGQDFVELVARTVSGDLDLKQLQEGTHDHHHEAGGARATSTTASAGQPPPTRPPRRRTTFARQLRKIADRSTTERDPFSECP